MNTQHNKHITPEEQYFAQEEIEKLKKLALEKKNEIAHDREEEIKKAHWMKCPKCGHDLQELVFRGCTIDKCFTCNGIFLDSGELESLIGEESGILNAVLSLFKSK